MASYNSVIRARWPKAELHYLQQQAQRSAEPPEQQADVLAEATQHSVNLVAVAPEQVIAVEVAVAFHVADDRLNRRTTAHFTLDGARHTKLYMNQLRWIPFCCKS